MTHIAGRTWMLEGVGYLGLYLLDSHRCILLDSGDISEREELAHTLDGAGLTPVGILNTHIHTDHSINNRWLKERYSCAVAAPEGELHLIRSPLSLRSYLPCWSPGTLAREFSDMVCPVDCPIPMGADGDFSFCGVSFQVIHTPGHSEDHVCVITPDNICYVGDALFGRNNQAKLPYMFCVAQALESTARLTDLTCSAYLLSHRELSGEVGPLIAHTRALLFQRMGEIRDLVTEPITNSDLFEKVNEKYSLFSSRPIRVQMMWRNFSNLVDYLVDTGDLVLTAENGQVYLVPGRRDDP